MKFITIQKDIKIEIIKISIWNIILFTLYYNINQNINSLIILFILINFIILVKLFLKVKNEYNIIEIDKNNILITFKYKNISVNLYKKDIIQIKEIRNQKWFWNQEGYELITQNNSFKIFNTFIKNSKELDFNIKNIILK